MMWSRYAMSANASAASLAKSLIFLSRSPTLMLDGGIQSHSGVRRKACRIRHGRTILRPAIKDDSSGLSSPALTPPLGSFWLEVLDFDRFSLCFLITSVRRNEGARLGPMVASCFPHAAFSVFFWLQVTDFALFFGFLFLVLHGASFPSRVVVLFPVVSVAPNSN
jgi:hypothetical protein